MTEEGLGYTDQDRQKRGIYEHIHDNHRSMLPQKLQQMRKSEFVSHMRIVHGNRPTAGTIILDRSGERVLTCINTLGQRVLPKGKINYSDNGNLGFTGMR